MIRGLALVLAAASTVTAASQAGVAPPAQTALILGRVVDGTTRSPIGGVTVVLSGPPPAPGSIQPGSMPPGLTGVGGPTRVLTSGDGFFLFHSLAEGAYTVTASKTGYVTGASGRRVPGGGSSPIRVGAGERKGDVTVTIWKHATISGTVVDERGEPLIGVQVRVLRRTLLAGVYRLQQLGNQPSTDDRGAYRISTLEPGDYVAGVVSTRAAVPMSWYEEYQRARAAGNYDLMRTLDGGGFGMSSGGVRVGSHMLQRGAQGPGESGSGAPAMVPPSASGPLYVYPTIYYPAAATPGSATVIKVASGEERGLVDFQLKPVPSVSVSGTVIGPAGPSVHTPLQLLAAGSDYLAREYSFEAATTTSDATGAFAFLGVTSGQYVIRVLRPPARPVATSAGFTTVIQMGSSTISSGGGPVAQPPVPDEPTWWAGQPVTVGDSDVGSVAVTLRSGARVGGRVEFDGSAARPAPDRLQLTPIMIERSDGRSVGPLSAGITVQRARVDAEGRLTSYQLPAGSYVVRASSPGGGWSLAGVMLNGVDVSATPFELGSDDVSVVVRYTDRPSEISGTVRDDQGGNDAAAVLVFPADAQAWTGYGSPARRFQTSRASETGSFRLLGLADGDYFVAAVREEQTSEWRDPEVLKKLVSIATRVTITAGQKSWVDLKTGRVR